MKRFIFSEECIRANTPLLSGFGLNMVGPLLMQFGTDEQKQRFLPKILSGEELWCQGYSEPNSGSDLASLQLKADKDGDDYVLNGQKTWTSAAHHADWIFLLCRTSTEDRKQLGITFLLADMTTTGIDAKPFMDLGGQFSFCDTFFTDARVPQTNRVGDEGEGWKMAKALLGHERTGIGGAGLSARWLQLVKRIARETPVGTGTLIDDPRHRNGQLSYVGRGRAWQSAGSGKFNTESRRHGTIARGYGVSNGRHGSWRHGLGQLSRGRATRLRADGGEPVQLLSCGNHLRRIERDSKEHHCQERVAVAEPLIAAAVILDHQPGNALWTSSPPKSSK